MEYKSYQHIEFANIRDINLRDLLLSRGFKCETE